MKVFILIHVIKNKKKDNKCNKEAEQNILF